MSTPVLDAHVEDELNRLRAELAQSHGGDRDDEEERAGIRERIAELESRLALPTPTGDVKGYPPLKFTYRNWRGEVAIREATPCGIPYFGSTEWHPERQWLLPMIDAKDGRTKDFAMKDMAPWGNLVGDQGWGLEG